MNTIQELKEYGFDKSTIISMLDNYKQRIGSEYGCWKLIDINYDFSKRCQMWTMKCGLCGTIKTVKRPKLRDIGTTCRCQKIPKNKKEKKGVIYNNDNSYLSKVFGNDKVVGFKKSNGRYIWICECQLCGHIHNRKPAKLKNGVGPRCQCQQKSYEEYIGLKNNYLTVIGVDRRDTYNPKFECRCDCGSIIRIQPHRWKNGLTKSCGCKRIELLSNANTVLKHSPELDRLRRIYGGMKQRCYNPKSCNYDDYGRRGISICDEWLDDRDKFIEWALNNGYSNELSIDRIDVNGNYEPSNCRWADNKTQIYNRRPYKPRKTAITWTINGITKTLREWCREYGIIYETVQYRISHKGMTIEQALLTPKETDGRPRKVI